MKSEVEVMAVRPEEDETEDKEGGEVEVGTDAERLRAEEADGYLKRVADPRKPTEQEVKLSLPHPTLPQLVSMLCDGEEGFGLSEGSRWRKRAERVQL